MCPLVLRTPWGTRAMVRTRMALAVVLAAGLFSSAVAATDSRYSSAGSFSSSRCTRDLSQSGIDALNPDDANLQRQIATACGGVAQTARGAEAARARF